MLKDKYVAGWSRLSNHMATFIMNQYSLKEPSFGAAAPLGECSCPELTGNTSLSLSLSLFLSLFFSLTHTHKHTHTHTHTDASVTFCPGLTQPHPTGERERKRGERERARERGKERDKERGKERDKEREEREREGKGERGRVPDGTGSSVCWYR